MLLLGAGSSIPFGIPGMRGFTEQFIAENRDVSDFLSNIGDAVGEAEQNVGMSIPFDLETLLTVLTDLSGSTDKPISIPTVSLLLMRNLTLRKAREEYANVASDVLQRLQSFVFHTCMTPIKKGKEKNDFSDLDRFYGPLVTVLNRGSIHGIQPSLYRVYSTNWDLCFKTWADYVSVEIIDGTDLDKQSLPVLNVRKFDETSGFVKYVPLHGALDLVKMSRPKGSGTYEDILKISDPIRYFEDKPANIRDIFMIYPLEAVGYEESVKSPYLEMLTSLRANLRTEPEVFIIGYSLRDPTIGSIIEEAIVERIRGGQLSPLSADLDSRQREGRDSSFKIIVVNPEPEAIASSLRKLGNTNLLSTFIPIKTAFPKVSDQNFKGKYGLALLELIRGLVVVGYIDPIQVKTTLGILGENYDIHLNPQELGV